MALIDCTECGSKISNLANACPKCGHPQVAGVEAQFSTPVASPDGLPARKSRGIFYYVAWAVAVLVVLFLGSAIIFGIADSNKRKAIANDPNAIHADDVVSMMESSYGCEFPSAFSKALQHRDAGELTAWATIVNNDPFCFHGGNLKANQKWTVLQVKDNVMQISLSTAVQAQTDMKRSDHNYWTLVEWGIKEKP
ncbi:zinc ribbon domain-containing protein [Janthinobacterium sp. PC23-8]|uniref:zinc ribbon domain-containing protein n=1 Tax=Janthinobacterium sp. PC23-8 TaxID=2012679 RepID=UPI001595F08A|nr:zinc ribbon domain-containing protein [Janthinobacterium sp. PC23-8]